VRILCRAKGIWRSREDWRRDDLLREGSVRLGQPLEQDNITLLRLGSSPLQFGGDTSSTRGGCGIISGFGLILCVFSLLCCSCPSSH
jgi:hypothetical protein